MHCDAIWYQTLTTLTLHHTGFLFCVLKKQPKPQHHISCVGGYLQLGWLASHTYVFHPNRIQGCKRICVFFAFFPTEITAFVNF